MPKFRALTNRKHCKDFQEIIESLINDTVNKEENVMYLPTDPDIINRFVKAEKTNQSDELELPMQETDEDSKQLGAVFDECENKEDSLSETS